MVIFYKSCGALHPAFKNRHPGRVQTYFFVCFFVVIFVFTKKCNPFRFSLFLQYLKGIKTSNVLT